MKKIIYISILILSLPSIAQMKITSNGIHLNENKNFSNKIKISSLEKGSGPLPLEEIGMVAATAQSTYNGETRRYNWINFDQSYLEKMGMSNSVANPSEGSSIVLVNLSQEFKTKLKTGQKVLLHRYAVQNEHYHGIIVQIGKPKKGLIPLLILARETSDWVPGTTVEVNFPMLTAQTYRIPLNAIIHIGTEDYIIKVVGPNHYIPKHITVIEEKESSAIVIGALNSQDQFIGDGAILLKPQSSEFLEKYHE